MGSAKYKVRQAGACRCFLLITNGEPQGSRNFHFVPPTSYFVLLSERQIGICRDVQRTNYKGQFRSSARLRLAILNGCGGAAGNFQIVLCPLYIVLSNINLSVSEVWRPQSKFRSRGSKSSLACRRNQPARLSKLLPALQAAAEFEFRSLRLPI